MIVELNLSILIIVLSVHSLNTPIMRQRLLYWIKKTPQYIKV